MPSEEERKPLGGLDATQSKSGGLPLPSGYLDDVSRIIAVYRTLEGLERLVECLGMTSKSHVEKIEQITRQTYAIPYMKRDVIKNAKDLSKLKERQTTDLNRLGQRLDREISDLRGFVKTAKTLGYIALTLAGVVGAAVAGYIFRK